MAKEVIYLNTERTGYGPEQCGRTLTVGELIALLEEYDEDTPVFLKNDEGYTYGRVTEGAFELDYAEDLD